MLLGVYGLGQYGLCELPAELALETQDPNRLLLEDKDAQLHTVVRAYPAALYGSPSDWPYGMGNWSLGWVEDNDVITDVNSIITSHRRMHTASDDNPPNFDIRGRLKVAFDFEVSIGLPLESSESAGSIGRVVYANPDGEMDYLTRKAWDGRRVQVFLGGTFNQGRYGEVTLNFEHYAEIFAGVAAGIEWNRDTITVALSSPEQRLSDLFDDSLYLGTGGLEGDSELTGQSKPTTLGNPKRITGKTIDKTNFVIQVHNGQIEDVLSVYVDSTALSNGGPVADVWAWSPIADTFVYDLINGVIRLGTEPAGTVAINCEGSVLGGTYSNDSVTLARYAVGLSGFTADDIDGSVVLSREAGVYYGGAVTYGQIVNDLLDDTQAWVVALGGVFTIIDYVDPDIKTSTRDIRDGDPDGTGESADVVAGSLQRTVSPQPVWRVKLNHTKNYAPLTEGVSFLEPYETSIKENVIVKGTYPRARAIEINTHSTEPLDTLAQASLDSLSKRKSYYSMTLTRLKYRISVGDIITLYSDRFGLSGGIKGQVLKVAEQDQGGLTEIGVLCNG